MRSSINGSGHYSILPDAAIPDTIINTVFVKNEAESPIGEISQANAEFEGDLLLGKTITWLTYDTDEDDEYWQPVQNNEEPDFSHTALDTESTRICGNLRLREKLDIEALRELQAYGYDSTWYSIVEEKIYRALRKVHINDHFATMFAMIDPANMGNNAGDGSINLGSIDTPILIPADEENRGKVLRRLYENLKLTLQVSEALSDDSNPFMMSSAYVGTASNSVFVDLNTCCGSNNVRFSGQMEKTIYGFDNYTTNQSIMTVQVDGKTLHYILVGSKHASGFVHDMYNVKWLEKEDHFVLTATEVHGSYVVKPWDLAIAVVEFELE